MINAIDPHGPPVDLNAPGKQAAVGDQGSGGGAFDDYLSDPSSGDNPKPVRNIPPGAADPDDLRSPDPAGGSLPRPMRWKGIKTPVPDAPATDPAALAAQVASQVDLRSMMPAITLSPQFSLRASADGGEASPQGDAGTFQTASQGTVARVDPDTGTPSMAAVPLQTSVDLSARALSSTAAGFGSTDTIIGSGTNPVSVDATGAPVARSGGDAATAMDESSVIELGPPTLTDGDELVPTSFSPTVSDARVAMTTARPMTTEKAAEDPVVLTSATFGNASLAVPASGTPIAPVHPSPTPVPVSAPVAGEVTPVPVKITAPFTTTIRDVRLTGSIPSSASANTGENGTAVEGTDAGPSDPAIETPLPPVTQEAGKNSGRLEKGAAKIADPSSRIAHSARDAKIQEVQVTDLEGIRNGEKAGGTPVAKDEADVNATLSANEKETGVAVPAKRGGPASAIAFAPGKAGSGHVLPGESITSVAIAGNAPVDSAASQVASTPLPGTAMNQQIVKMESLLQNALGAGERLRPEGNGQMEMRVRLGDGAEDVTVRMQVANDRMQVTFQTDSPAMRKALEHGWQQFSATAAQSSTLALAAPRFEAGRFETATGNFADNPSFSSNQQNSRQSDARTFDDEPLRSAEANRQPNPATPTVTTSDHRWNRWA